jgi:hypothetical protein
MHLICYPPCKPMRGPKARHGHVLAEGVNVDHGGVVALLLGHAPPFVPSNGKFNDV